MKRTLLKLMAIKPHKYGTRHLTAGEEYEAPTDEAVAHVALRKADFAKPTKPRKAQQQADVVEQAQAQAEPTYEPEPEPEPTVQPESQHTDNMLGRLRAEALQLGIDVDGRWGMARLQHEISQARRR